MIASERGEPVSQHESKPQSRPELFTVQVQGKGLRFKARVPGWVVAALIRFAKENEARA